VYTAQDRQWSITARVSIIVEGACFLVCGILFVIYSKWMLRRVKLLHHKELNNPDIEGASPPYKEVNGRDVQEAGASIEKGEQEERYPELDKDKANDVNNDKNKGEIVEEKIETPAQEHAEDHIKDEGKQASAEQEQMKVDNTDKDVEAKTTEQPVQEPAKVA
jgi:hypothetical protein